MLQEEEYEWGNQRAIMRLPKVKEGSTEAGLAVAGYKYDKILFQTSTSNLFCINKEKRKQLLISIIIKLILHYAKDRSII